MVPRRQDERHLQLRRPPRRGRARRQGRVLLGRRACRRPARDHLRGPPARDDEARERAEGDGRPQGHAGRHLHGDGSRDAGRDARLRAHRRAAHGRLRRLLRRLAVGPPAGHGVRGPDHAGRGVEARDDRAAEAHGRRGGRGVADGEERRRPAPHRQRRADAGGPRPLVARRRDGRDGVSVRADGLRGSPLPPLHERHDREAEGDRPHHRGVPRRRRVDAPLHLRREARLGVLVRRRRRLGHRPQLHRLRAAHERHDRRALRGHARLPRQGPLVGDRRALQGRHPLHGADRDPRAHEVGHRARGEARPLVAAPARLGRRADQPRSVGVVPPPHRRQPHAGRRHVVADRDRDDPDHAASRA